MSKGKTRKIDRQMRQIEVDSCKRVQINVHFYPLFPWRFVCNNQRHYTALLSDKCIAVNNVPASPFKTITLSSLLLLG